MSSIVINLLPALANKKKVHEKLYYNVSNEGGPSRPNQHSASSADRPKMKSGSDTCNHLVTAHRIAREGPHCRSENFKLWGTDGERPPALRCSMNWMTMVLRFPQRASEVEAEGEGGPHPGRAWGLMDNLAKECFAGSG